MVQWITQSTCSGGVMNSGECDCAVPVGLVLGSSFGKLYSLSRKLSEGSDRAEVGENGLATAGALGRLWRVLGGRRSCGLARESWARCGGGNKGDGRA
jgi:hypothetical protein